MIATNVENIGQEPIDFYSIGHVIMGMISHIIGTGISLFFVDLLTANLIGIIVAFSTSLFWETIENNILIHTHWKNVFIPEKKENPDTLNNSLADQIFVLIGVVVEFCLFSSNNLEVIFYSNLAILNTLVWMFIYLRKRTIDVSS